MHHCTNVDPYSHEYDKFNSKGKLPSLGSIDPEDRRANHHLLGCTCCSLNNIRYPRNYPDKNQPEHSAYL